MVRPYLHTFTLLLCITNVHLGIAEESVLLLEDFTDPHHVWKEMNDPVMGGQSTGTFNVSTDGVGVFSGEVVDVPFLEAPGFIQARTVDRWKGYPDVRVCRGLQLTLASDHPDYTGYRFSFGRAHPPNGKFFAFGYKTSFEVPATGGLQSIRIPFSEFTDLWDDATGDPIVTCQDDEQYCPSEKALKNLGTMAVWAEGVAGEASLKLHTIEAYGCDGATASRTAATVGYRTADALWKYMCQAHSIVLGMIR